MSEGPLHLTFRDEGMSELLGDHKELSLWVPNQLSEVDWFWKQCMVGHH